MTSTNLQHTLRSIDTLVLDGLLSENEIEHAIIRLKLLVNDKRAKRVTSQSQFWKAVFAVPLSEVGSDRSVTVTVYLSCTTRNANIPIRIQANVALIKEQHAKLLMAIWKTIFPINYKEVAGSLKVQAIDEAYDHEGSLDNLILERPSSTTAERYYDKTDAGGRIQTAYIGAMNSPSRGILYDLSGADVFRNAQGEAAPLNLKTATHALLQRKGMIRIESRRTFSTRPLTLDEVLRMPSAFHEYLVFDLSRLPRKYRRNPLFMGYVDCVRLRGLHGAAKWFKEAYGGGRAGDRAVLALENSLSKAKCSWWSELDHHQQLGNLLKSAPFWHVLNANQN